jgi:tetratricopeptide (TPR) repeat protein
MRGFGIAVALLTALASAAPLRAGVYHRREMQAPLPTELNGNGGVKSKRENLRGVLDQMSLKGPNSAEPGSLRADYLDEVAKLEAKADRSAAEQLDLSADYIRLGRFDKARDLLEGKIKEDEPLRFLLLSNLAAAYWGAGVASRAEERQLEALKAWPLHHTGWTWEQWHRYRRAEGLLLKIMQSRPRAGGLALDPLFLGVTFSSPDKKYEVGGIPSTQADRLPGDAEALTTQLILWLPADDLLYWYYGELLNARGAVADAFSVLDLLVNRSGMSNVQPLFDHRRALKQALDADPALNKPTRPAEDVAAPSSPPPDTRPTAALPSWQQVGVGFLGGVLVAVAAVFQIREWRRRGKKA